MSKTKYACLDIPCCSNTKDAGLNLWQLLFLSLISFFWWFKKVTVYATAVLKRVCIFETQEIFLFS